MHKWRAIHLMMAAAIALSILPIAHAADINLSDTCTLADAIKAANTDTAAGDCPAGDGADTIMLAGNITLGAALPPITTELTVEGEGFTISGRYRFRIFVVNGGALTVNSLTMTKGKADLGGAIANVNGGTLTINDSTITISSAEEGGAIYNMRGRVAVTKTTLHSNTAAGSGGAIYIDRGSVIIEDSTVQDNEAAGGDGGAVYSARGRVHTKSSDFLHNVAYWSGGAISSKNAGMTISDSRFTDNTSGIGGGAIYYNGQPRSLITASTFEANKAGYSGGAILSAWPGNFSIMDSTFRHNSADDNGGAISSSGSVEIYGSTLIGNSARGQGGAVRGSDDIRIESSTISGNVANREGGGLYDAGRTSLRDQEKLLLHVTLLNNSATRGGGLYTEDRVLRLINTIVARSRGGDCYGALRAIINSVIEDGSCFATLSGDPMLGDLIEREDGSPPYYPLIEGSPAIDAADSEHCQDTDIIGTERPQGAGCDIGAYEWVPADN